MLPSHGDEQDPAAWFELAADRLKVADLAWKHEGLTASGIELPQEAAERYLKGYLIANGWRLIRTHDLDRLVTDAAGFDTRFERFHRFAEELTEDFFALHYPGQDLRTVGANYEELRTQSREMLALIKEVLPQYFPPE
jgi:HEPN domain-containing protein